MRRGFLCFPRWKCLALSNSSVFSMDAKNVFSNLISILVSSHKIILEYPCTKSLVILDVHPKSHWINGWSSINFLLFKLKRSYMLLQHKTNPRNVCFDSNYHSNQKNRENCTETSLLWEKHYIYRTNISKNDIHWYKQTMWGTGNISIRLRDKKFCKPQGFHLTQKKYQQ